MKQKLRQCCVCGEKYHFCPHCPQDGRSEIWYTTFCSENCKNVYEVTSNFDDGIISKPEAKNKLLNLNLSKQDNFGESYKKVIKRITDEEVSITLNDDTEVKTEKTDASDNENEINNTNKSKRKNKFKVE